MKVSHLRYLARACSSPTIKMSVYPPSFPELLILQGMLSSMRGSLPVVNPGGSVIDRRDLMTFLADLHGVTYRNMLRPPDFWYHVTVLL
jgi:hypothetical protein